MFILVTGKPRSGKSYFAVDYMMKNKDKYYQIFTDINGFKLHDNIKSLPWDYLYNIIGECKNIYDSQKASLDKTVNNDIDSPIHEYLLSEGLIIINPDKTKGASLYKPVLIVIDEAHDYFPSKDPVSGKAAGVDPLILWWISYHGHLYMDVIFLSQNYKKMHEAYLADIEYFLNSRSSSLLGNKFPYFTYSKYPSVPFYKKYKSGTVKIKKKKEIFEYYKSGDIVRTKSVIYPILFGSLVLFVIVVSLFYYVKSSWSAPDRPTAQKSHDKMKQPARSKYYKKKSINRDSDFSIGNSDSYIGLTCSGMHCTNKRFNISLNLDHLKDLLKVTDSRYLSSTRFSDNYSTVYLLVSPEFKNLFKGAYNEKNKGGFTLIK